MRRGTSPAWSPTTWRRMSGTTCHLCRSLWLHMQEQCTMARSTYQVRTNCKQWLPNRCFTLYLEPLQDLRHLIAINYTKLQTKLNKHTPINILLFQKLLKNDAHKIKREGNKIKMLLRIQHSYPLNFCHITTENC